MNDMYKPNSNRFKEEQKTNQNEKPKVEKVVQSVAKTKSNDMRKLAHIFISEDASSIKNYIIMDVIIPTIKDAIMDTVSMLMYGKPGVHRSGKTADKVNYRDYYKGESDRFGSNNGSTGNSVRSYDDIVFNNRGDAELVLSRMKEMVEQFDIVSVADMYEMADIPGEYTYNNYGWTDLGNAQIARTKEGYIIKLPRAGLIKNMK